MRNSDSATRALTTNAPGLQATANAVRRAEAQRIPPPPAHADPSTWRDPDDLNPQARSPKTVSGFRRGDVLALQARRGRGEITDQHIKAVRIFRAHWDVASYGLSGRDPQDLVVRSHGAGPRSGPTVCETQRYASERQIVRVRQRVGEVAWPFLIWVAVWNRDVSSWCIANGISGNDRHRKTQGRLLAILDILAEHFGTIRENRE